MSIYFSSENEIFPDLSTKSYEIELTICCETCIFQHYHALLQTNLLQFCCKIQLQYLWNNKQKRNKRPSIPYFTPKRLACDNPHTGIRQIPVCSIKNEHQQACLHQTFYYFNRSLDSKSTCLLDDSSNTAWTYCTFTFAFFRFYFVSDLNNFSLVIL